MKRVLLAVLVLAVPASSWATSFVYDAGAGAPTGKSDHQVNPAIPANEKLTAAEVNQIGQNEYDLRDAITHGYYWGLAGQTVAPPQPSDGTICFNMQDGGTVYCEYPDAGTFQIGGGLKLSLPGGLYSPGQVDIDGGATVDGLYAKGLLVSDGGFSTHGDVNAAGNVIANSAKTDLVTAAGLNLGVTVSGDTANGSAGTFPGVVVNNDQALNTAGDKLLSVRNNNVEKANVDYGGGAYFNGLVIADGGVTAKGVNALSNKVTNIANGSAATDAAAFGQKEAGSISGVNPTGFAAATAFATQYDVMAGVVVHVSATAITQSASTNTNGNTVFEIYDSTTTTDLCDVTFSCDCAQVSGPCTKSGAGSVTSSTCAVTINSNDQIEVVLKSTSCTAAGSYNVSAWWF
ncbi:MAG: hypothetical protein JST54_12485 [Deltaproteobacteria bacterium]|nr:hypothetical protein [Deltaproteobacteria bacterium]